jgi:hypothetical protein
MLFGSLFTAGIALLATALIPDGKFDHNWPVVALCWLGTIACSTAFGADYTITKELFPTPLRYTFEGLRDLLLKLKFHNSKYATLRYSMLFLFNIKSTFQDNSFELLFSICQNWLHLISICC